MPIHLCSSSRREFLGALGGGALAFSAGAIAAETSRTAVDENLVYILNDTHIGEKHPPNSLVPSHLRQAVEQLLRLKNKPVAVLINGDLALKDGQPGDYRHFARLIAPLREAKIAVHLTLGNHDHRDVFYDILKSEEPKDPPIAARHVSVIRTRHANFFLLDSLIKTMVTQGEIGEHQTKWLTKALDDAADKPAIVVTHHNPRLGGDPLHFPGGLIDSEALWKELTKRPHVKAYIHGHIHDRTYAQHQGIQILNTPATSYVADPKKSTTGWTAARFSAQGVQLTTHTNQADHPWNGQHHTIRWKA